MLDVVEQQCNNGDLLQTKYLLVPANESRYTFTRKSVPVGSFVSKALLVDLFIVQGCSLNKSVIHWPLLEGVWNLWP